VQHVVSQQQVGRPYWALRCVVARPRGQRRLGERPGCAASLDPTPAAGSGSGRPLRPDQGPRTSLAATLAPRGTGAAWQPTRVVVQRLFECGCFCCMGRRRAVGATVGRNKEVVHPPGGGDVVQRHRWGWGGWRPRRDSTPVLRGGGWNLGLLTAQHGARGGEGRGGGGGEVLATARPTWSL
jgi:hypothetical protein